jgi:acyl-CoA dehydrogenase
LTSVAHQPGTELDLEAIRRIGADVAGPAAREVDRDARFPHEAIDALRAARALSALVPVRMGGAGWGLGTAIEAAEELGRHCGSTAMVWAMHQIQLACLVRHGAESPTLVEFLREAAEHQLLIGSATSEVGAGGDLRTSVAAVELDGEAGTLRKSAPTVSYAECADAFLATARRSPAAAPGDQVMVLLRSADTQLEQAGDWDTLGMRGTCSNGFDLTAGFPAEHVFPVPFGDIAVQTMVPVSHLLWAACWTGIADAALSRARAYARAKVRAGNPVLEARLADAGASLQLMHACIAHAACSYDTLDAEGVASFSFGLTINNVKTRCSELAVDVVSKALSICGIAGYSETSSISVARHLRDVHSAALMISNDRLYATNGRLMLAKR